MGWGGGLGGGLNENFTAFMFVARHFYFSTDETLSHNALFNPNIFIVELVSQFLS